MEAAQLVNGAVVLPIFAPGEQMSQQLSDFNDLANKSVLGIDAVKRQMKTVVDKAIQGVKQQKIQNQIEPFRQERSLAR